MKSGIGVAAFHRFHGIDPVKLYRASPAERIAMIKSKRGIPASIVQDVSLELAISNQRFSEILGLPRATINRKMKKNESLSTVQIERVLGMIKLIGQVKVMVEQSGNAKGFNAAKWVARWLDEPSPALGGKRPADFMDTAEGQTLVSSYLARIQTGSYA